VQVFGTWKVARADRSGGVLWIVLRVGGRVRVDDGFRLT
jgi:hypothetical protein